MVLIDMPMPKGCRYCQMVDNEFQYCHGKDDSKYANYGECYDKENYRFRETRPDWCPLKEVDKEVDTE